MSTARLHGITIRQMLGEEFFCGCAEPQERWLYGPSRRGSLTVEGAPPPPKRTVLRARECARCGRPLYNGSWDEEGPDG